MKGKEVIVDGYFGKEKQYLVPIPDNPPTITDRWGFDWLYLGYTDEYTLRVGKLYPDGWLSTTRKNKDHFPCFGE